MCNCGFKSFYADYGKTWFVFYFKFSDFNPVNYLVEKNETLNYKQITVFECVLNSFERI